VVATLAGAASYRELGSVAAGLPQETLSLPGARWDLAGLVFIAPSAGTLRRVLIALDTDELDRAVGAWLALAWCFVETGPRLGRSAGSIDVREAGHVSS
jgi:hypothetical protein